MSLTVLSVAFPFAPVGRDSVGGSEQVLCHLDEALVRAGHHSIVVACEGSTTAGTLVEVPRVQGVIDDNVRRRAQARHYRAILRALDRWPVDLIHMHAFDFHAYMPPAGVPLLATLHLPPHWYPEGTLHPSRPDTWLHCVSEASHAACSPSPALLDPIENGVPVEELAAARHAKRSFAMFLGRICWEKGVTVAIEAAKLANISLLIGGEVAAYAAHQEFFAHQMSPTLDARRRFIGPIGFQRKRRLLTAARCLLVPSLAPETSSLVAREALACGTPVIAFPRGALSQTIEHGRTGYLVGSESIHEMAEAIAGIDRIDPDVCRAEARRRFSLEAMVSRYFEVYQRLATSSMTAGRLTAAE